MKDLPWHNEAGVSAVEAFRNWCDVLLAEKAQAVQALAEAQKLQAEAASVHDNVASIRTAVEGSVALNAKTQKLLGAQDVDLKQREAKFTGMQADLEARESALAQAIVAFKADRDRTAQELMQREALLASAEKRLEADKTAHQQRVTRVKEAVA